jgi:hypothetical protein
LPLAFAVGNLDEAIRIKMLLGLRLGGRPKRVFSANPLIKRWKGASTDCRVLS